MAREKMFNAEFQKAFTECILKENQVRREWHRKYGVVSRITGLVNWDADPDEDMIDDNACDHTRIKPVQNKHTAYNSAQSLEVLQRYPSSTEPVRYHHSPKRPPPTEKSFSALKTSQLKTIPRVEKPPKVMKPITKECKELLSLGSSRVYLKHRYEKPPMERFRFPMLSSWQYGWDNEQQTESYCPKHKLNIN
ncbi:hypothetical protein JTE90_024562 [Oedothorax gibbosus]|uniref:Sperm microtubule inner protein 1 C-terminal domain-containing protein n=1 Tax=Oedothorax gibbosus TaxID=931172 RepID=A0AAV6VF25_9ARAC|nr:hypothetical protein JTE90_024562 [Oedothorax gibbosus]